MMFNSVDFSVEEENEIPQKIHPVPGMPELVSTVTQTHMHNVLTAVSCKPGVSQFPL